MNRNAGFPINDIKQAENLRKQLGHENRTSNDGMLHCFTNWRNAVRNNVQNSKAKRVGGTNKVLFKGPNMCERDWN